MYITVIMNIGLIHIFIACFELCLNSLSTLEISHVFVCYLKNALGLKVTKMQHRFLCKIISMKFPIWNRNMIYTCINTVFEGHMSFIFWKLNFHTVRTGLYLFSSNMEGRWFGNKLLWVFLMLKHVTLFCFSLQNAV